jgi:hypothetical protein
MTYTTVRKLNLAVAFLICGFLLAGCTTVKTATLQNGVVGDAILLPITLPMAIAQDLGADTPLGKKYCCSAKSYPYSNRYNRYAYDQALSSYTSSNQSSVFKKKNTRKVNAGDRMWKQY